MLEYKINVIKELEAVGINTTVAKNTGIFGQATMQKFRKGDTKISLDNLNRLCAVLEMQPRDIIKYVETQEDRDDYINIIHKKQRKSIDITKICDIIKTVKESTSQNPVGWGGRPGNLETLDLEIKKIWRKEK